MDRAGVREAKRRARGGVRGPRVGVRRAHREEEEQSTGHASLELGAGPSRAGSTMGIFPRCSSS